MSARAARAWTGAAALVLAAAAAALGLPPETPALARDEAQMLEALGYAEWTGEPEDVSLLRSGVLRHDPERSGRGLNLFLSRGRAPARLVDMDGRLLHTWEQPLFATGRWQHAEALPDGSLVAIVKWKKLVKMGWDSELVWELPLRVHHDLDVAADGTIHVLVEGLREVELGGRRVRVDDHEVLTVTSGGRVASRLRLFDLFGGDIDVERIAVVHGFRGEPQEPDGSPAWELDVFHANSVELLRRDVPGLGREGDLLLSLRNLDLVAVVDPRAGAVRWRFGPGELERQHHPTLLPSGNVLIYDNGSRRGWSRVVEVDPRTNEIVWQYRGRAAEPFFSDTRGSVQRLPNGNTLIAESNRGRVFEVSPEGEIVWEYLNPDLSLFKWKRGTIYRVARLPEGFLAPLDPTRLAAR